jgi:hypothetical protein
MLLSNREILALPNIGKTTLWRIRAECPFYLSVGLERPQLSDFGRSNLQFSDRERLDRIEGKIDWLIEVVGKAFGEEVR